MTKPVPKPKSTAFGLVLVFGLIVAVVAKSLGTLGPATALIICVVGIGALIGLKVYQSRARLAYLRNKYGNEAIVQGIIQHHFWEGQTSEQLVDSIGNPASVDQKVLKTRKREIWKYNRQGVNRYGLRITLDGDIVVGWDQKSHDEES
jgi:hypothetical protein